MARASASPDVIVAPVLAIRKQAAECCGRAWMANLHPRHMGGKGIDHECARHGQAVSRPSAGRSGSALDGSGRARPSSRRQLLLLGGDDRRLLPPVLRRPAGQAEERPLSREPGRGRGGRLSPLQAVQARPAGIRSRYAARVAEACRSIEEAEETPSLAELAQAAGLSTYHFHRVFKAVTGLTPRAYAAAHRSAEGARRAVEEQHRDRGHLRSRLQLQQPLLRGLRCDAGHDADRLARRRRRRQHPLRHRRMLAGLDPGGAERQGHLRHPRSATTRRRWCATSRTASRAPP